jgi:hypothetical protein
MEWGRYVGHQVRVYRNLNNGRISVQAQDDQNRWKVVAHVQDLVMCQVSLTVRQSGRQRVIAQRQKNVHAWAEGRLVGVVDEALDCPINLAYDPYRNSCFVERSSQKPIVQCQALVVRNNRVFVSPDALILTPIGAAKARNNKPYQIPLFWQRGAYSSCLAIA